MKFKVKVFTLVLLLILLLLFWLQAMIVDNVVLSLIFLILLIVVAVISIYVESKHEIKIESEIYNFDNYDEFIIKLKRNILSNKYVQVKNSDVFVREYNDGKYHIKKKLFLIYNDKKNNIVEEKLNKEVNLCIENNKKYKGMQRVHDKYIIQPILIFDKYEESVINCGYMYSDFPIFDSVWINNFVMIIVDKEKRQVIFQGMTGNSNDVYNYNKCKKELKRILKEIVK